MNTHRQYATLLLITVCALCGMPGLGNADNDVITTGNESSKRLQVERITLNWSSRGRLAAIETMASYGPPQEITAERLIWHDVGAFKRITAFGIVVPHDFPLPHFDVLEHTVSYAVPIDRVDDVLQFDGSVSIDRTAGEMSARCDLEAHNVLALNLAHDVAMGAKSARQARDELVAITQQEILGKEQAYTQHLQFAPAMVPNARTTDSPGVIGAPVSAGDFDAQALEKRRANDPKQDEAEMLATLIAIDMNQINAAVVARDKNLHSEVADFARALHEDHGRNVFKSMEVAQQVDVTPVNTQRVLRKRERGAAELAEIVPLNAGRFEGMFLKTTIEAQAAALREIEGMMSGVHDDILREHLAVTRRLVLAHRDRAQELQRAVATSSL